MEEETVVEPEVQEEEKEVREEQPEQKPDMESAEVEPQQKSNKIPAKTRINQLTRSWREAEREKERLQAELAQEREAKKITKAPKEEDYEDYEDYLKDQGQYRKQHEEAIRQDERQRFQQAQQKQQMERERLKVAEAWQAKKQKAIKKFDNFIDSEAEVLEIIQSYGAVDMQECILESKVGPEMVDYLANNYDEAEKIASLPPRAQARTLLRLENKLESIPVKKTKPAPEPIKPVGTGGAKIEKAVVDMSPSEYREWAKKRGM